MIKVREDALNYKYKKEKKNILNLHSSQKISPRTKNNKEYELEKWVTKERLDIDKTKQIYEENMIKTGEILKETMGIDNAFTNFSNTQSQMHKLLNDKVNTPREGLSHRSGFSNSRRTYELSKINKELNDKDIEEGGDNLKHYESGSYQNNTSVNINQIQTEEDRPSNSLLDRVGRKIKTTQQITFGELPSKHPRQIGRASWVL